MESGEKELRQAFEETTRRNVQTNVDYSTDTRKIVRELEGKITLLESKIMEYEKRYDIVKKQIIQLQMKSYEMR